MIRLPSRQQNPLLWTVITFSLLIHVVALVVFGGRTVFRMAMEPEAEFVAPDKLKSIDPEKIELQARLQEKQQQSTRPQRRIEIKNVANIEMKTLDIAIPVIATAAAPGNLSGIGGSLTTGGISMSDVEVDVFGITGKGQKFLFLLDVSGNAMRDSKGGIPAFKIVQEEVIRVVRGFPRGLLFNVIFIDEQKAEAWQQRLVPVTDKNLSEFETAIRSRNLNERDYGVRRSNLYPTFTPEPLGPDRAKHEAYHNTLTLHLSSALEMQPDTIYVLTSRINEYNIMRALTPEEEGQRLQDYLSEVRDAGFETAEEAQKERERFFAEAERIAERRIAKEAEARKKQGLPPKVWGRRERQSFVLGIAKEVAAKEDKKIPPRLGHAGIRVTDRETEAYWEQLFRRYFDTAEPAQPRPLLNLIYFKGKGETFSENDAETFEKWVEQFSRGVVDGDYEVLEGLDAIRRAAQVPPE